MMIGSCILELTIFEANSLKDKRQVIKSLIRRIQSRFNVSVAEIDKQDSWRSAVIGFACVSSSARHAGQMVNSVIQFVEGDCRVEIMKQDSEIL